MIKQAKGKIFLSDNRGVVETAQLRRYSTFNFGAYFNEHKTPFDSLYILNEEMVAGSQQTVLDVEEASYILTLPVTGEVHVTDLQGNTSTVHVEQVQVNTIPASSSIQLVNPYKSDLITFLQIGIKAAGPVEKASSRLFNFNFNSIENQLTRIVWAGNEKDAAQKYPFSISIGRFDGRKEALYTLKNKNSTFFAFVIAGAFEIEGRLLHEKDGLALWDTGEIELEALSNHAIVVVIELM